MPWVPNRVRFTTAGRQTCKGGTRLRAEDKDASLLRLLMALLRKECSNLSSDKVEATAGERVGGVRQTRAKVKICSSFRFLGLMHPDSRL